MRSPLLFLLVCLVGMGCGASAGSESPPAASPGSGSTSSSSVYGHLPAEVIQQTVREFFSRFQDCYEDGLREDLTLSGRVSVSFVITRDGSVASVKDGGSSMPSPKVVGCLVDKFKQLRFPEPGGGIVTVVYPIMFSQGRDTTREGDCVVDVKSEERMIVQTRTCPKFALMVTLLKTDEGVSEAFALGHLMGFESGASATRAQSVVAGKTTWTSTIAAGSGKPFRKLSIVEYKPNWGLLVSCQDERAADSSKQCDDEIVNATEQPMRSRKP